MKLTLNGQSRIETDNNVIANLIRKGWVEVAVDAPPNYDPTSQRLVFSPITQTYSVVDISPEDLKQIKFQDILNNGYLVEPENIRLGLQDEDRNAFTQMMVLLREALNMGLITLDSPQSIKDKDSNMHVITVGRFQQIIISYGFYYKTLWDSI